MRLDGFARVTRRHQVGPQRPEQYLPRERVLALLVYKLLHQAVDAITELYSHAATGMG